MRTLEEFGKICACGSRKESHNPHYTDDVDLKEEMIKFLKELRYKKFYCIICERFECDCSSSDCFKLKSEDIENWIKYFFSIKEDELDGYKECVKEGKAE